MVDVANFVFPVSLRDLTPRSLLELLGFDVVIPGNGGKAQSWLISSGEGGRCATEGFRGFEGDRRLDPVLAGEARTEPWPLLAGVNSPLCPAGCQPRRPELS